MRADQDRFEAVFSSSPVGMAVVGGDGEILRANGALRALWGDDPEGRHLEDLIHAADVADVREQIARVVGGELAAVTEDLRLRTATGRLVPATVSVCLVRDGDGVPREYVVQVIDVSEAARLREMVRHEAEHDALTHLLDRRAFTHLLDRHVAAARRNGGSGALLVLDVDALREVNRSHGLPAGDAVLEEVARTISGRLDGAGVAGRIGGDELAVLLPEADAATARRVAADLCRAASEHAVDVAGARRPLRPTVSAAIVPFDGKALGGDALLADADAALLEAKADGRGRSAVSGRRLWANRVRAALEAEAFTLDAQAVVDTATGAPVMYELLLRLREDGGAVVRPALFLGAAQRYGLMRAIDEWVVHRAVALARERPSVTLTVNLSGDSVGDPSFLPYVVDELRECLEVGERLVFEIAERTAVADLDQARRLIVRLRESGCRFALDDFGAGGFHHLKHLPVEFLKLDGEFTRTLPGSPVDREIVGAIVQAAAGLGKTVIAGCVEDGDILAELRGFGIPLAQGLHVGRPAPAADLLAANDPGPAENSRPRSPRTPT